MNNNELFKEIYNMIYDNIDTILSDLNYLNIFNPYKNNTTKWFFNSYKSINEPQKPLISLTELLQVWRSIQDFFWLTRLRFNVLQDLMLSTLLPVKKDISYNTIPPTWFKYIPNRRELSPVCSGNDDLVLKAFLKADKEYIENPGDYSSPEKISGMKKK